MKIGILGSSFNPAHLGHLKLSDKAIQIFDLDEVWWMITKQNPLKEKDDYMSFEDRNNQAKKLISNNNIPRLPSLLIASINEPKNAPTPIKVIINPSAAGPF